MSADSPAHQALQQRLQYSFQNPHLLAQALTHRSFSADHNERLEFLGDSVLNLAVSRLLFKALADLPEGEGRDLAFFACSACHGTAIIKAQGMSRERWSQTIDDMGVRGMAPLDALMFFQTNFIKGLNFLLEDDEIEQYVIPMNDGNHGRETGTAIVILE